MSPNDDNAESTVPAASGRFSMSASTQRTGDPSAAAIRDFPALTILGERSQATLSAPRSAASAATLPVPAARSSIRAPATGWTWPMSAAAAGSSSFASGP